MKQTAVAHATIRGACGANRFVVVEGASAVDQAHMLRRCALQGKLHALLELQHSLVRPHPIKLLRRGRTGGKLRTAADGDRCRHKWLGQAGKGTCTECPSRSLTNRQRVLSRTPFVTISINEVLCCTLFSARVSPSWKGGR